MPNTEIDDLTDQMIDQIIMIMEMLAMAVARNALAEMGIAFPTGPEVVLLFVEHGKNFSGELGAIYGRGMTQGLLPQQINDQAKDAARRLGERVAVEYARTVVPAGPVS
jgi:hypothetical protein